MISSIKFTFGIEKDKDGKVITAPTPEKSIQVIRREVAKIFGGYTETAGHGGWVNTGTDELVEEASITLEVAITSPIANIEHKVTDIINIIKLLLNQECVLVQHIYGTSAII